MDNLSNSEEFSKASNSVVDLKMDQRLMPSVLSKTTYSDSSVSQFKSPTLVARPAREEKQKTKRPYTKRRLNEGNFTEKPPPKKRGRKSKKELLMMNKKPLSEDLYSPIKTPRSKKVVQQKLSKKSSIVKMKMKKPAVTNMGSAVFDKRILVGPHLTMKQVLEYILTDHSYCVPPDPLPAIGSNHQMIRYIVGPKNVSKARPPAISGFTETGDRSPIAYSSLPRSRGQLNLPSTPPPSSKLEHLLKRGDASPLGVSSTSLRLNHIRSTADNKDESDIEIDIETVDSERRIAYDTPKALEVMKECERYVEFARNNDTGDDWESKVLKTGWTKTQSGLFDKVVGALHAERLARLSYDQIGDAEPILRRVSVDRTASRIRRIFGEYFWDAKLTQWLHDVLTESLNYSYLAIYLDVLQTLKSRCPQLISRMMTLSVRLPLQQQSCHQNELTNLLTPFLESKNEDENTYDNIVPEIVSEPSCEASQKSPSINADGDPTIYLPERTVVPQMKDVMMKLHCAKHAEALKALLGRQWDPYAPILLHRLKKLSANPVFLMIAPSAIFPKLSINKRLKQYNDMFRRVGKVINISSRHIDALNCVSVSLYIEKLMSLAKDRMREIRISLPDRPLYIVGWGSGAILAARLSVACGPMDGIIALGFPLLSLRGMHEDLLKVFCGIKHPILFVIGGLASNNSLTDMELFRKRLACETSLVVVGAGNENLFVPREYREKLLVTQSYVDKNVMDEIAYFVNLHSKHNQMSATIAANISMKPPFPKSHTSDIAGKRQNVTSRGRKRSSSVAGVEHDTNIPEDSNLSKNEHEKAQSPKPACIPKPVSVKREPDLKSSLNAYDYDFDGPKFIPSNKSSNKRKAYYRPDPSSVPPSVTSSSCITASKLVQQSPNAKRRISKPSGPSPRVPLLGQPSSHRNSQQAKGIEPPKDDANGLLKYLNNATSKSEQPHQPSLTSSSLPLVLRQSDGPYQSGGSDSSILGNVYYDKDCAAAVGDKATKKKTTSKVKSASLSKDTSPESPTLVLSSAITDAVQPNTGNLSFNTTSSLDMHKYVLQHQQMIKQLEQHRQDGPQTSHLFKLLSPKDSDNFPSISLHSGVTQTSDVVKLQLLGSQPISSDMVVDSQTATALISKQNLVSNMSLPMIRLSMPEEHGQKSLCVAGPSSSSISNTPAETGERIFLRATDKGLVKLNISDLKTLISGSRGVQIISGMSSATGQAPINIMVNKPQDVTEAIPSDTVLSTEAPPISTDVELQKASNTEVISSEDSVSSCQASSNLPNDENSEKVEVLQKEGDAKEDDKILIHESKREEILDVKSPTPPPQSDVTDQTKVSSTNLELSTEKEKVNTSNPIKDKTAVITPSNNLGTEAKNINIVAGTEVSEQTEPVDTDEEMSGLRISSTFSVCPVSGERVIPEDEEDPSALTTESGDGADESEQKSKKPLRRSARLKSGV